MRLSHAVTTTAATAALMTIPGMAMASGGSSPAVECDGLSYLDKFTPGKGFDQGGATMTSVDLGKGLHDVAWKAAPGVTIQKVIVKAANQHFTPDAANAGTYNVPIKNAISHVTFCGTTVPATGTTTTVVATSPDDGDVCAEDSMAPGAIDNKVAVVAFSANGTATVSLKPDTGVCAVEVHLTAYSVNGDVITDDKSDYLWDDQVLHASDSVVLTPESPTATLSVGLPQCNWQLDLYTWDSGAANDGDPRWELGTVANPTSEGQWVTWDRLEMSPHHGRTIRVGTDVFKNQNVLLGWKLDLDNGACEVEVEDEVEEDSPVLEDSPLEVEDSPIVEDAPVEDEDSPIVEDAPAEDEDSPVQEDSPVEDEDSPVLEDSPVEDEDSPVVEDAPVEDEDSPVVEDAPAEDEDSPIVEDAPAEDEDSPIVEDAPAEDEDSPIVEDEDSPIVEDAPAEDEDSPVQEDSPVEEPETLLLVLDDEESVEEPEPVVVVLEGETDETDDTTNDGTDVLGEVIDREPQPAPAPQAEPVEPVEVADESLPVTGSGSGVLAIMGLVSIAGGAGMLRRGTVTMA